MWLLGGIIGLFIGAAVFGDSGWLIGAILGVIAGVSLKSSLKPDLTEINNRLRLLDEAVQRLNKRLDALQKNANAPQAGLNEVIPSKPVAVAELAPQAPKPEPVRKETLPPNEQPLSIKPVVLPQAAEVKRSPAIAEPVSFAKAAATPPSRTVSHKLPEIHAEPGWFDIALAKATHAIKQFIFGGNTLVKVGSLILFLGLAFLLRYAASQFTVPIELRYAGVAASALALLGFGWWLRNSRRDYALILQGLAIAVLYLTIYAAMKLHPLLPPALGFMLMVVVCASSVVLAVTQNSLALAMAGCLGGFATPVLASTGGGSHVALFSYIALLDAGIVAVAWFRAWRVLNLVGFFGTFGLYMAWYSRGWQEEHLVSAELFLLLFFLMFVGILIRFAHHLSLTRETAPKGDADRDGVLLGVVTKRADYIDGTLAFGVPLLAFGLHAQMTTQIEFGASFGALGFGAFYLGLAAMLRKLTRERYLLLTEVFIALGVVFATLAIPLGLEPQWTASSWALEAAGIFWIGIRQQRPLARMFAALLMLGSIYYFFRTLHFGYGDVTTPLDGSIFGCCLIAASLLFVYWLLRNAPEGSVSKQERDSAWMPALAGTLMTYLLPPLLLSWENCGTAWGVLGLLTLYLALRFVVPVCVWAGFLIQLFAGVAFVTTLHGGADGTVLGNGYSGLFSAMIIGGAMLAGAWMGTAKLRVAGPELSGALRAVSAVTVVGLSLLNVAFLFVLPLQSALTAWALSSTLIVALALRMGNRVALWFALGLEMLAGLLLLSRRVAPDLYSLQQLETDLLPFQHSGWWSALVFSLCGFAGAWLLKRAERKNEPVPLPNVMLLVWGALWWAFAWSSELLRWLPEQEALPALVVALVVTQLLWWAVARWQDWAELRRFAYSHLPLAFLLTLASFAIQAHPLANYGWLVWPLAAAAHFFLLHEQDKSGGEKWQAQWHVAGVWWLLLIASGETRWQFASLGEQYSAWPMLGWALVPLAYLWWAATWSRPSPWPMTRFLDAYRRVAAMPVAILLALWLFVSNLVSNGAAQPLPYIPLLNPLELTLMAGALAIAQWVNSQSLFKNYAFLQRAAALGYALIFITAAVFRAVHHWAAIPWDFDQLSQSILLQGVLSVVWAAVACAMMLLASRKQKRELWMAGAGLIAAVVLKLFLIELSHTGTVERIVSFMVVGVLLLVLGYFAPVPPKKKPEELARQS
ncbi:MAG: DUF2339 domain-containing protein [Sideroxyarcus sp.]